MASVSVALTSMLSLLVVTALGYVAAHLGYLNDTNRADVSNIILNLTLPCTIIGSATRLDSEQGSSLVLWSILLGAVLYFLMFALGLGINRILRVPREYQGRYLFMGCFTNITFLGIPMVSELVGGGATFLAAIFVSMITLFVYSINTSILRAQTRGDDRERHTLDVAADKPTRKTHGMNMASRKNRRGEPDLDATTLSDAQHSHPLDAAALARELINVPLLASIAAIILFFSGLQLPTFLQQAADIAGAVTAPLGMMLLGQALSRVSFGSVLREKRLYIFTILRLVLAPLLSWWVLSALGLDRTVAHIFTIMLAMPVGSIAPIVAASCGVDATIISKGTIFTTVASFVTIPLIVAVMSLA